LTVRYFCRKVVLDTMKVTVIRDDRFGNPASAAERTRNAIGVTERQNVSIKSGSHEIVRSLGKVQITLARLTCSVQDRHFIFLAGQDLEELGVQSGEDVDVLPCNVQTVDNDDPDTPEPEPEDHHDLEQEET